MQASELPWETWRAVIAVLREKALPSMLEHANVIEEQLERHGPDEPMVRLSLTDDVFPRFYNGRGCIWGFRYRWSERRRATDPTPAPARSTTTRGGSYPPGGSRRVTWNERCYGWSLIA